MPRFLNVVYAFFVRDKDKDGRDAIDRLVWPPEKPGGIVDMDEAERQQNLMMSPAFGVAQG